MMGSIPSEQLLTTTERSLLFRAAAGSSEAVVGHNCENPPAALLASSSTAEFRNFSAPIKGNNSRGLYPSFQVNPLENRP